ncbi:SPP1 family predicted phage head-tail adaptor [Streptococcus gallinaceus]|uniref:phage head closure protein n=1 Tax=Streptococcus gallinaceus TaxID=165758 RepID=UPI00209CD421|nr:phage head closure protein [Streptococcus gallinaceus]MCP1638608.1 SPP1 family predicted phage head-tail adaptor [Streptococcus gallinaceus]MCP1769305.1 SPP1 family predicted phage head-tail adaptor [Streptococcus gallinaceus]
MKVSILNERITILKSMVKVDEIGNHSNEWKEVYTCFATISNESSQETTDHGVIYDDSKIDFTIRYASEVATLSSTGYRVRFNNQLYNLMGIDHMSYKKKSVKLHCQRIER